MFPGANATVYLNDEGEVIGWDYPSDDPFDGWEGDDWLENTDLEDLEDEDEK